MQNYAVSCTYVLTTINHTCLYVFCALLKFKKSHDLSFGFVFLISKFFPCPQIFYALQDTNLFPFPLVFLVQHDLRVVFPQKNCDILYQIIIFMLKTEAPPIVNYEKQMVAEKALHFLSLHNLPFTVFNDHTVLQLFRI